MDIEGYEDYLIYEDGRVYSKKRNKFLRPNNHRDGYLQVNLYKNNKVKRLYIHRLVALHYVDNPDPVKYKLVDHLDRHKSNNYRTNLRWCDYYINNQNQSLRKDNTSGEQFICYSKRCINNPYIFKIVRNKIYHSKQFKTMEEAIAYRDNFLLLQQQEK